MDDRVGVGRARYTSGIRTSTIIHPFTPNTYTLPLPEHKPTIRMPIGEGGTSTVARRRMRRGERGFTLQHRGKRRSVATRTRDRKGQSTSLMRRCASLRASSLSPLSASRLLSFPALPPLPFPTHLLYNAFTLRSHPLLFPPPSITIIRQQATALPRPLRTSWHPPKHPPPAPQRRPQLWLRLCHPLRLPRLLDHRPLPLPTPTGRRLCPIRLRRTQQPSKSYAGRRRKTAFPSPTDSGLKRLICVGGSGSERGSWRWP